MLRKLLTAASAVAFVGAAGVIQAGTVVMDGFESGALNAPASPAPAINTSGFSWDSPNNTAVVRTGCKAGTYCLQFRYPAGQFWSEQRFRLGAAAYKDIWLRYWTRVPVNYTHGTGNPTNHKLFALWMDDYSAKGNGPTIVWEFWGNGSGGSDLAVHYSVGGYTGGNEHVQWKPFIAPADRGKWMELVMHVKAATTTSSNDGVIQLWRRWDGQSAFTKLHELTNADIGVPAGGPQGWNKGYFMGWANAAYASETAWLIDNVTISDESLLTAAGADTATDSPPNAPILTVQ